jgi:hypothetical protein
MLFKELMIIHKILRNPQIHCVKGKQNFRDVQAGGTGGIHSNHSSLMGYITVKILQVRDFRLLPHCKWYLRSSMLRSVDW